MPPLKAPFSILKNATPLPPKGLTTSTNPSRSFLVICPALAGKKIALIKPRGEWLARVLKMEKSLLANRAVTSTCSSPKRTSGLSEP